MNSIRKSYDVNHRRINNGLTVCTDYMPNVDSVSLNISVRVGGRCETPEEYGISHFIEHMAFKGTPNRDKKKIASELDALGGSYNAYTSKEYTSYVCKVPAIYFEEAFSILADIITNSDFSEEEIKPERDVICQEISMVNDDPSDIIFDKFYETCYAGQSFGAQILGPVSNILKFTRDDFLTFVDKFYKNQNIYIATAGNISQETLEGLSEKYFPQCKGEFCHKLDTPVFIGGEYREERDIEQVHVVIGLAGISKAHPDYFKMKIATTILGAGMSSRLFQEIRENLGLAYSVSASNVAYTDTGIFVIYGAVSPDKVNQFIEESINVVKKMIDSVTDEELERTKKQMLCGILMQSDATSSRVGHLISSILTYGRYVSNQELIEIIEKITINDIKNMIELIMTSKKSCLAMIGKLEGTMRYEEFVNKIHSECVVIS